MEETSENKPIKYVSIGLLAHVDAGKTTLSEALLYESGSIRSVGRVDKGDAFLDTFALERERGITIFSKQAVMQVEDMQVTILDTPGHLDFSAEMERTLSVLDYAVLVISGADGVQAHTQTLWRLLKRYEIPVFLFINKMDQPGTEKKRIMEELKKKLSEGCIEFEPEGILKGEYTSGFQEGVALLEEQVLENFLESGVVSDEEIKRLIKERKLFPCFFGSALKLVAVDILLDGIVKYAVPPKYPETFGAQVFKIGRDDKGNRLAHMKIVGGSLAVKMTLPSVTGKVNQIRIYSGEKYETVSEAFPGMVCAVSGLEDVIPGKAIGCAADAMLPALEPVLHYRVVLPEGIQPREFLPKLRELEEEEPMLCIVWNEHLQEIQAKLMGEVQTEVLKSLVRERFGIDIAFDSGSIVYKETIADITEGIGHFEPLRHYAEVHLILEPGEAGSGLRFATDVSEDELDRNWQRLILTHLEEREHCGVLTGAAITDMKITLAAARAHKKHTEGGDFRQATYRAVRQGLMKAESVLLEPYYDFSIEVPEAMIGRAMSDLERMKGVFEAPALENAIARLEGKVPAVNMQGYQRELSSYTKGMGKLSLNFCGYEPCHNSAEIIEQKGYRPESDLDNPADSVFCQHGAGLLVPWSQVEDYMHLESCLSHYIIEDSGKQPDNEKVVQTAAYEADFIDTKEVERILAKTFHANKREKTGMRKTYKREKVKISASSVGSVYKPKEKQEEYLLVDGYNVIFAGEELKALAEDNIDGARGMLLDMMCNYQGIWGGRIIVVFDAYRVERHVVKIEHYHNIYVVFTAEAQTADQYIEKFAQENRGRYQVTVATSDNMEQVITRGQGCALISARELLKEAGMVSHNALEEYGVSSGRGINKLSDVLEAQGKE